MEIREIPKIIHLCWFSGEEYPELIKICIESWKKNLPDFQIKIWTKEMALSTKLKYVEEAINVHKWAFAADVIRLYALYTEGGVYMDSDIAIRKSFDNLMTNELVLFQEYHSVLVKNSKHNKLDKNGYNLQPGHSVDGIGIQAALMMSVKGHPFVKTLLSHYENRTFINVDGTYDMNIIAPAVYASYAERLGYRYVDEIQELEKITIYPSKFVSPSFAEVWKDSFALHCCSHSWYDPKISVRLKSIIKKVLISVMRLGKTKKETSLDIVKNFLTY